VERRRVEMVESQVRARRGCLLESAGVEERIVRV